MSRSATPATRNEATTRLKTPKRTTSAELPIGTAIRTSYERLRTVANGCGRLRTVADGCDHKRNVERTHPQSPDPQSETGTLATHSGKNQPSEARQFRGVQSGVSSVCFSLTCLGPCVWLGDKRAISVPLCVDCGGPQRGPIMMLKCMSSVMVIMP